MVDVNDTNGTTRRLEREREMLESADIDERDREAIQELDTHREEIEGRAPNTLINDLGNCRRCAERADTALVDMTMRDVRNFLRTLTTPKDDGGYGLEPEGSGLANYERALRVFFGFLDAEAEYGSYEFYERIDVTNVELGKGYDRDELLTESEVSQLKAHTKNDRDRTVIDFLADVGARISLATSLRVGDVEGINGQAPQFTPNENAINLKGVEHTEYPILHSRGELRSWLNIGHEEAPDPHPDAPLFPVTQGYDPGNRSDMAASTDTIRDRLGEAADRAGIDKPVRPHAFRHVTLTRIANAGLDDRDLEHMSMLADLRMIKQVYDHTTGEERNLRIQQAQGFVEEVEIDSETGVATTNCSNCRQPVKTTDEFCSACGTEVSDAAREKTEDRKGRLVFDLRDIEDPTARDAVADLFERVGAEPIAADHEPSSS